MDQLLRRKRTPWVAADYRLSPEYRKGKYVHMDLEIPSIFIHPNGEKPLRKGFQSPGDPDEAIFNIDASRNHLLPTFGVGLLLRNWLGALLAQGCGCFEFPFEDAASSDLDSKNPTSTYMELYAALIALVSVSSEEYPRLLIRCDNKKVIDILTKIQKSVSFEEILNVGAERRTNDLNQMMALMGAIKAQIVMKYTGKGKRLRFEWVYREENYPADRLSHIGRKQTVGKMIFSADINDWTFLEFVRRDLEEGFCWFPRPCYVCKRRGHLPELCPKRNTGHRCFVGGLAWSTNRKSLARAFTSYGKVVACTVCLDSVTGDSKGFGFVTFADERSMRNAIRGMHRQKLHGRGITVQAAESHGSGGDTVAQGGMTLEEYQKVREEEGKALAAMKAEERKVELDEGLKTMKLLVPKKANNETLLKLGSSNKYSGKQKVDADCELKAKKPASIREFLKPAEGERRNHRFGGGQRRGDCSATSGGDGGHNYNYARTSPAAPSIEDIGHFPPLGRK